MTEIYNLPSYYSVSTTCITRLLLTKLILFYSFFTEPWSTLTALLGHFIRSIPGLAQMSLSMVPMVTPILSAEIVADTMVLMGLCWKSRACLAPWLCMNIIGIVATAFTLVNKALPTITDSKESVESDDSAGTAVILEIHVMMYCLTLGVLLTILCYQYSTVLEIYFHLHRSADYCARKRTATKDNSRRYSLTNGSVEKGYSSSSGLVNSKSINVYAEPQDRPVTLYPSSLTESLSLLSTSPLTSTADSPTPSMPASISSAQTLPLQTSFQQPPPPPPPAAQVMFQPVVASAPSSVGTNLTKEGSQSSNVLDVKRGSLSVEDSVSSDRNTWNTFKFDYDDEKFS